MLGNEIATGLDIARGGLIFQPEALRQAQCAERLAGGEVDFRGRADDEFDAAAADVDAEGRAAVEVDRRADGAVDVVGLLLAGNHTDADARFLADAADELAAIRRFAPRAGGHVRDPVHLPAEFTSPPNGLHHCVLTIRAMKKKLLLIPFLLVPCGAFAQVTPAAGYTPPDDTPKFNVGATIFGDFTHQESPEIQDVDKRNVK